MSFIGDLVGAGSGAASGMGFNATPAKVIQPVDQNQLATSYGQTQSGLTQQQNFVNSLMGVNGIGNQQNVFNQQQGLANQLQGVANGTGPNPALAQLNQSTGQNVAAQNALMAGQRGSGANAGLLARQAAMQGANIQQQAAGQGATLSAQQQLAAMGALSGQQNSMANLANSQIANQAGALGGFNTAAQNQQTALLNALGNFNNANVNNQSNVNNVNAGIANTVANGQQGLLGGALNSVGGGQAKGLLGMAKGGQVPQYFAEGGDASLSPAIQGSNKFSLLDIPNQNQGFSLSDPFAASAPQFKAQYDVDGPNSFAGKYIQQAEQPASSPVANQPFQQMGIGPGAKALSQGASSFGISSGDSSGGGGGIMKMIPMLAAMSKGGSVDGEKLAAEGKMVPGKAVVKGDSLKNDKINAKLSPKEIVLPRSITLAPDAPARAAKFVAAILAKNGRR